MLIDAGFEVLTGLAYIIHGTFGAFEQVDDAIGFTGDVSSNFVFSLSILIKEELSFLYILTDIALAALVGTWL